MVWSDQSQFPFNVYDNNGDLIATIDDNGMTIYGNGQLNIINQIIAGLGITVRLNGGTGAPVIVYGGRTSTGGLQYYLTFDDQNDNAFEEFITGGQWRIHNTQSGWRIYDITNFDGYGFDPTDSQLKAIDGGTFSNWTNLTLKNGWTALAGYGSPAARLTPSGGVELKGTIRAGTIADNTNLFDLPASMVPGVNRLLRPAVGPTGAGNVGSSRLFCPASANVYCYGMAGVTDVGLDGLVFYR